MMIDGEIGHFGAEPLQKLARHANNEVGTIEPIEEISQIATRLIIRNRTTSGR